MENTTDFIREYKKWSSQFKNFNFIRQLSPTWEKRLSEEREFNIYPLFLGMYYPIILGIYPINLFMFFLFITAGVCQSAYLLILYFLASLFLCFKVNSMYLTSLKKDYERFQDFNPKAETPYFNISYTRLWICTLLSNGLYLIYWFYRNAEAIKTAQKNRDIGSLPLQSLFYSITSYPVLKSIKFSSQTFNYPDKLNTALGAFLIFLLPCIPWIIHKNYHITYLSYTLFDTLTLMGITFIIYLYQKAINYYSQEINEPQVESFTAVEIIIIVLGGITTIDSLLNILYY